LYYIKYHRVKRKITADLKAADARIEGATNDVTIKGMTPAVETIQAFAREIAQGRLWRGGGEATFHVS